MGSGHPQYRSRDNDQSMLFSSHFPKRPVPIVFGTQLIFWLLPTSFSLINVVRMYQLFFA
jgi:hypothetical protein